MKIEIRVELLDYDLVALIRTKPSLPPTGISIEGPTMSELRGEGIATVCFIVMTLVLPIAPNLASAYLFKYLSSYRPKRIRIDREEISFDRGEVERIVRTKIEIQE